MNTMNHAVEYLTISSKLIYSVASKTLSNYEYNEPCSGCIVGQNHQNAFQHQQRSRQSVKKMKEYMLK
jgi:hypothetical protein